MNVTPYVTGARSILIPRRETPLDHRMMTPIVIGDTRHSRRIIKPSPQVVQSTTCIQTRESPSGENGTVKPAARVVEKRTAEKEMAS